MTKTKKHKTQNRRKPVTGFTLVDLLDAGQLAALKKAVRK